ncbi:erythronate-4-phosphate dehydrogenase [Melioribacter roseus P3M-2]|uniref:Erythronate-4-phosphate dehydrogenase n=1 Tax=Melioribacter roseus (strain DSM 23840 / JCM 17771 / VKM B-2668 / P3M-2) TaxID=1191523 RepID=I7A0L9_MELRP|nr:4-phosphoerythronate dehydrogenase [Melioribacter roseus]AFN74798.1 erythronate-4-phosphate dehydrogenase [Melioribacter roseus P3M-2]
MLIIADENIPQVKKAFGEFGEVKLFHGRSITQKDVIDADVLLVRSITRVDKDLLEGTNVKFVATATIGTDHIDKDYLNKAGIRFADAAGCNAYSVAEYVVSAITEIFFRTGRPFQGSALGIVGYGNIGTKVDAFAKALGVDTILNDPPLKRKTGDSKFKSLEEALNCDIITFHVPLNKGGMDNTVHLLNEENINIINDGSLLINSSRGAVVDNHALKKALIKNKRFNAVLDVWENEPAIDRELLDITDIATPHIAGYSYEGKLNSTLFIYNKFCEYAGVEKKWKPDYMQLEDNIIMPRKTENNVELMKNILNNIYDINDDSLKLKEGLKLSDEQFPRYFDELRKNYRIRREFFNYKIDGSSLTGEQIEMLKSLRFEII